MFWNLSHVLGIKKLSSSFSVSRAFAIGLTVATAFILLASNFVIISAQQQQVPSQPGGIDNGTFATTTTSIPLSTFQSTNDSFRVQVPQGWQIDDVNNTGPALQEEGTLGYGVLAQLCPEGEIQSTFPNVNGSGNTSNCVTPQNEVIHVIRYPDLETRIQPANNVTAFHLQKLQEVGYRSMQIVTTTDMTVNLTNPLTNDTVRTLPAKFVEMIFSTASAPNEIRNGYFVLTFTNVTAPNVGTAKGYSVFYEANANTSSAATPGITRTTATSSGNLAPASLPPAAKQIFDSFELMVAPEVARELAQQGGATGQPGQGNSACHPSYPDSCIPPPLPDLNCGDPGVPTNFRVIGSDPHGFDADNDGIGCDTLGAPGGSGTPAAPVGGNVPSDPVDDDDGGDASCHPSYPDTCIPPPPPNLNCDDVDDTNFEVVGSDPHGFDGDNDGIGCESGSGVPDEDDGGDDDGGDEEPEPPEEEPPEEEPPEEEPPEEEPPEEEPPEEEPPEEEPPNDDDGGGGDGADDEGAP